ncbi:O-antigen ligase family protein [Halorubrum sp. PV6]|uniref:O-antigen ligase family protein n=1 Tax=Halorubrum sp. PV6 TaxID=634157 RepID=UPI000F8CA86E|nr:O-antigen ligase family protein [Halorubrum sp. PV6]
MGEGMEESQVRPGIWRLPFRILLFTLPFPSVALLTISGVGFGLQMVHVSLVVASIALVVVFVREKRVLLTRTVGLFSLFLFCVIIASYMWVHITPTTPYFSGLSPSIAGQLLYWVSAIGYLLVANVYTSYVSDFETLYQDWGWFAAGATVAILVGGYEIISYYSIIPFPHNIVYSNPTFALNWGSKIAGIKRFTSSFPEPSMFALYGSVALGVIYGLRRRVLLIVFTTGMLLALSTSAVIGIMGAIIGFLYLSEVDYQRVIKLGITSATLLTIVVIISETLRQALYTTTIGKINTHSGNARLEILLTGLRAWVESPIFGWGIGAARTTDGLSTLLISFGVLGAVPLGWFFLRTLFLPREYRLARGLRIGLFAGLIVHLVAVPDWIFPFIWVLAGALWAFPPESHLLFHNRSTKEKSTIKSVWESE